MVIKVLMIFAVFAIACGGVWMLLKNALSPATDQRFKDLEKKCENLEKKISENNNNNVKES